LAGLHVLGRCLAALGRREDARRAFREALGGHERTQFDVERRRLEQNLGRLRFEDLLHGPREVPRDGTVSGRLQRVELADGRAFLTQNRRLVEDIRSAATSDLPVLIEGETGTGKELVARLLHEQGPLARAPFVVVDCATLSPDLADVELFGATRGAYTGAYRDRPGLVAQADGGTLFLDELPELSHALQAKLLRLLQEGTYRRVGEDSARRARVRFVAATNRRVDELLRGGVLKPDLYYRLNGHRITLDPLRHRREEIAPLADAVAQRCGFRLTPAAREVLARFAWPGNTRQLEMSVRVAARRRGAGDTLDVGDLVLPDPENRAAAPDPDTLRSGRVSWERTALLRALRVNGGVVARAARSLGLTRQGFYVAMRRTGLTRRKRGEA
jgi:transcriptional regulator with PAS, ATPase and Fis domain